MNLDNTNDITNSTGINHTDNTSNLSSNDTKTNVSLFNDSNSIKNIAALYKSGNYYNMVSFLGNKDVSAELNQNIAPFESLSYGASNIELKNNSSLKYYTIPSDNVVENDFDHIIDRGYEEMEFEYDKDGKPILGNSTWVLTGKEIIHYDHDENGNPIEYTYFKVEE